MEIEKLTINKLAELGFNYIDHSLMSNGKIIIDTYARPYKCSGQLLETVEQLNSLLGDSNIEETKTVKTSGKTRK